VATVEISGGVDLDTIAVYALPGVDVISAGLAGVPDWCQIYSKGCHFVTGDD